MSKVVSSSIHSEELTTQEAEQLTVGPSITTSTWFEGNHAQATAQLRSRLWSVVSLNPWLSGSLRKRGKKLYLEWETELDEDRVLQRLVNSQGNRKSIEGKISSSMPFEEQCNAIGGSLAEVPTGSACIGNGTPLLSLYIVNDSDPSPGARFVVIFSVSHVIVDGFTYYLLLSMLSSNGEVPIALNAKRKQGIMESTKQAMGENEFNFANGKGVMCNVVSSLLCGRKPFICNNYIDKGEIDRIKSLSGASGASFISTNDIIASAFALATNSQIMLLPINFRGRNEAFTKVDAGNYEGALVFGRGDYDQPELIRKTLQSGPPTYIRGGGAGMVDPPVALPSCCEAMRTRLSMVTNWTFSHFQELAIDGATHLLHSPHCDTKMVPFDIAVVYHPRRDELAVLCFVRSVNESTLEEELPVGKKVSI